MNPSPIIIQTGMQAWSLLTCFYALLIFGVLPIVLIALCGVCTCLSTGERCGRRADVPLVCLCWIVGISLPICVLLFGFGLDVVEEWAVVACE